MRASDILGTQFFCIRLMTMLSKMQLQPRQVRDVACAISDLTLPLADRHISAQIEGRIMKHLDLSYRMRSSQVLHHMRDPCLGPVLSLSLSARRLTHRRQFINAKPIWRRQALCPPIPMTWTLEDWHSPSDHADNRPSSTAGLEWTWTEEGASLRQSLHFCGLTILALGDYPHLLFIQFSI